VATQMVNRLLCMHNALGEFENDVRCTRVASRMLVISVGDDGSPLRMAFRCDNANHVQLARDEHPDAREYRLTPERKS
jgi:hypothetical protein